MSSSLFIRIFMKFQIEQEERVSENLDKILKDFDEIKQENQTLLEKVKTRTSS